MFSRGGGGWAEAVVFTPSCPSFVLAHAHARRCRIIVVLDFCTAAALRVERAVPAAVLLPMQLTMFDTAMTPRQLEYLRKTHDPLIAKHGITQHHYDVMLQYLTEAMRSNDAQVCGDCIDAAGMQHAQLGTGNVIYWHTGGTFCACFAQHTGRQCLRRPAVSFG
jgi:flagellar biosynthesis protein FliP